MLGKLTVIGVGPGDPELLTIKAFNALKRIKALCVPKGREEGSSLALSIVQKMVNLDDKEIIEAYFPMRKTKNRAEVQKSRSAEEKNLLNVTTELPHYGTSALVSDYDLDAKWNETAETIMSRLREGDDVAFITLGDPTIYSTFYYLYDKLIGLQPGLDVEIIPGVSSITASAARAKLALGLGDDKIAILPANYMNDLKAALETFDTVVLMKVHKVFDQIVKLLDEMKLTGKAAYVCRAGMDKEKIFRNLKQVKQEDLNYFSMVIVRK
ncbi:MAG: precorrin-2 C(20)-methyltransferase [Nitrospirae bacterium]|nr:precorrin-2 C(20)-methyltransferase [Nitrospirota bacterium]